MRRTAMLAVTALALAACDADQDDEAAEPEVEAEVEAGDGAADAGDGEAAPDATEDGPGAIGPPSGELGAPVEFTPTVIETGEVAVALAGATVHTDGVDLTLSVHWLAGADGTDAERPGGPLSMTGLDESVTSEDDLPDDLLRAAITYPDGEVADTADTVLASVAGERPESPVLDPYEGLGDGSSWDQQLWLEPPPEPDAEPLTLRVIWPEHDIDEEAELDLTGEQLAEAADRVITLGD